MDAEIYRRMWAYNYTRIHSALKDAAAGVRGKVPRRSLKTFKRYFYLPVRRIQTLPPGDGLGGAKLPAKPLTVSPRNWPKQDGLGSFAGPKTEKSL
jgi:hypothetical protein